MHPLYANNSTRDLGHLQDSYTAEGGKRTWVAKTQYYILNQAIPNTKPVNQENIRLLTFQL